jgi:hypothetical protein
MKVHWRLHHEVYPELPPDQDFVAFDEETGAMVGRVYLMHHGPQGGRYVWTMTFLQTWGRPAFKIHGFEDKRGDAGRRVVEAYRQMIEHNTCDPRRRSARQGT